MSSNISAPPIPTLNDLVSHAVEASDATGFKTLLALGVKDRQIMKLASKEIKGEERVSSNFKEAKRWAKQNRKNKLPRELLGEIFSNKEGEGFEADIRFFFDSGGSFETFSDYLSTAQPPRQLRKKVEFLDKVRRAVQVEQQLVQEIPQKKGVASPKKGLIKKIFSSREASSPHDASMIDRVHALFRGYIQPHEQSRLIHEACLEGRKGLITYLGADLNIRHPETNATLLHTAANKGDIDMVLWLLDKGVEINPETKINQTPLHMACSKGHVNVAEALIERGADVKYPASDFSTALHFACSAGHEEITSLLIAKGADVKAENNKGVTPLHYACISGHASIAVELLKNGADPGVIDAWRETPLQASLKNSQPENLSKLLRGLFSRNSLAMSVLDSYGPKGLLPYFDDHAEELNVPLKQIAVSNPLEIAFMFNSSQMAALTKVVMPEAAFKAAIEHLRRRYPEQSFKLLTDLGLQLNDEAVYRLDASKGVPPAPGAKLSDILSVFAPAELYYTDEFLKIPQEEASLDEDGSLAGKLTRIEPGSLEFNESGEVLIDGSTYPYLAIRAGSVLAPVAVARKEGEVMVEPRPELLRAMLERINFTDRDRPGFRDPEHIVDSGSSADAAARKVSPDDLMQGITALCKAINHRTPYVGTPSRAQPEQLELWYSRLESLIHHIILASLKEDPKVSGSDQESDPTPWAPSVIELAISGMHCGTRSLDDAQFLYDAKYAEPPTIESSILDHIAHFKLGIGSDMVDLSNPHNVHVKNKIFQVIDEAYGIPETEKNSKHYFLDPIAPRVIDRHKVVEIFQAKFTPTAVIDVVAKAVNGTPPEINRERIIDWFKDNIPEDWQREKYSEIAAGLEEHATKEEKASYLQEHEIFINPPELKKPEEPNWVQHIEDARKYDYIEEFVQNQMTGKINREALIFMLQQFGVFTS